MVGNDIIDLELARAERKSENSRYLAKVFSEEEIKHILLAEDQELRLWQFWAMKEAAYKAHQRIFSLPRKLNPKAFHCALDGSSGKVSIDKLVYNIEFQTTAEYLHATTSTEKLSKKVFQTNTEASLDLKQEFSKHLPSDYINLIIKKNGLGIPSLEVNKQSEKIPFSLSHHGKFTAFAIPLINS